MAQKTTITLVDDLDGHEADEQIEFSVDGKSYEIDLSAANVQRLRATLEHYVSVARSIGARAAPAAAKPVSRDSATRAQNQAIREWAVAQGMKISDRGRIPSDVLNAYHGAH